MSNQEVRPKNLAYVVLNNGTGTDPVALLIEDREGRGQPRNVRIEDKTILWEGEDGVVEQIGFPKAPVRPDVLVALQKEEGIAVFNPGYEERDLSSTITISVARAA